MTTTKYVLMERFLQYNDEVYYFEECGNPLGIFNSHKEAVEEGSKKLNEFWLENEPCDFGYDEDEVVYEELFEKYFPDTELCDLDLTKENVELFISCSKLNPFYIIECKQY